MNFLSEILSSSTRAEALRLLFDLSDTELHHREMVRRSGLSESAMRQELGKLVRLDLVRRRQDGNRVYFKANREHPLFPELQGLVLKTVGLPAVLRSRLQVPQVRIAFIFGSLASGQEKAGSDVDLMVIGDVGLRAFTGLLSGISETIGREINPHVMTVREYQKRKKAADHFVTRVLEGPKLFLIGTEHELEAMGG
jgi:DNA-binding transcriptional ArsR family regulator